MYGFPGFEPFHSDPVGTFCTNWLDDFEFKFRHHLRRLLRIPLIAVNLATFVIALVPGQASIVHIGVRDIGADVMVVVPLELGGARTKRVKRMML